jgi:acyl-CoA dehydrogenase
MRFDLTEAQTDVIARARACRPDSSWDAIENWPRFAASGLAGVLVPRDHGGLGLGVTELALAVEELAAAGAGSAVASAMQRQAVLGGMLVARYGSAALRAGFLPGLCDGSLRVCLGMDAPDPTQRDPHLTVRLLDGALHGHVAMPPGRTGATHLLVPADSTEGIALCLLPLDRPGISLTDGIRLDAVEVALEEMLSAPGEGWRLLRRGLGLDQVVTAAGLLGAGRAALELGKAGVEGFTSPAAQLNLQAPLARHWSALEAARALLLKAAWLADAGLPWRAEAGAARLIAGEAAVALAEHAMPLVGGAAERLWRDARATQFAAVPHATILRCIAGRTLDLPRLPVAARAGR